MQRFQLTIFFLLTFLLAWLIWVPATLTKLGGGASILGPDNPVGQFARWAPGIAAVLLTGILAGRLGIGALFSPLKIWRVSIGWYLFVLLFQPTIFFAAKLIDGLLGKTYEVASPLTGIDASMAFVVPILILTALPGAFMEELGWRGFALPRLQLRSDALVAGIVLGLIWGIWHAPSMVFFGETNALIIGVAVLNFIPVSVLFTWIFNNTRGSLLLVKLFHASTQYSNSFFGIIPSQTANLLTWIVAIVVLVIAGATNLSRTSERIRSERTEAYP